jgi:cell wall-associated NlpC family hydrolase
MRHNILYSMAFSALIAGCAGSPPKVPMVREPEALSPQEPAARMQRAEALLQTLLALGVEYRDGGRSPVKGFDCSGLVAHVFREAYGIHLPHNTRAQSELGIPVSFADLEPGDLVFYNTLDRPFSHVGIYLGDSRFVHAPKVGSSVRVESLRTAYWSNRFDGARRINPPI